MLRAGYACAAHLPEDAKGFTTVELKSNFLGTAKSGVMRTEAIAEHMGRIKQVGSATGSMPKVGRWRCFAAPRWSCGERARRQARTLGGLSKLPKAPMVVKKKPTCVSRRA